MNRNDERLDRSALTLPTVLALIFLILKLTHVIDWPWVWVVSPIWISLALLVLVLIVVVIIYEIGRSKK